IYGTLGNRVETIFGDEIRALSEEEDSVRVQFDRSPPRPFDLEIGADGQHSVVRTLTFGAEPRFETYLGYCAAAFAVAKYPRHDENACVTHATPGKQAARFALRDGRTVFWSLPRPTDPRSDLVMLTIRKRRSVGRSPTPVGSVRKSLPPLSKPRNCIS